MCQQAILRKMRKFTSQACAVAPNLPIVILTGKQEDQKDLELFSHTSTVLYKTDVAAKPDCFTTRLSWRSCGKR